MCSTSMSAPTTCAENAMGQAHAQGCGDDAEMAARSNKQTNLCTFMIGGFDSRRPIIDLIICCIACQFGAIFNIFARGGVCAAMDRVPHIVRYILCFFACTLAAPRRPDRHAAVDWMCPTSYLTWLHVLHASARQRPLRMQWKKANETLPHDMHAVQCSRHPPHAAPPPPPARKRATGKQHTRQSAASTAKRSNGSGDGPARAPTVQRRPPSGAAVAVDRGPSAATVAARVAAHTFHCRDSRAVRARVAAAAVTPVVAPRTQRGIRLSAAAEVAVVPAAEDAAGRCVLSWSGADATAAAAGFDQSVRMGDRVLRWSSSAAQAAAAAAEPGSWVFLRPQVSEAHGPPASQTPTANACCDWCLCAAASHALTLLAGGRSARTPSRASLWRSCGKCR